MKRVLLVVAMSISTTVCAEAPLENCRDTVANWMKEAKASKFEIDQPVLLGEGIIIPASSEDGSVEIALVLVSPALAENIQLKEGVQLTREAKCVFDDGEVAYVYEVANFLEKEAKPDINSTGRSEGEIRSPESRGDDSLGAEGN